MSGVAHRLSQGGFEGFGAFFENRSDLSVTYATTGFFQCREAAINPMAAK